MGTNGLHHRSARRRQVIAQVALGVLAVPAIVLATGFGMPEPTTPEAPQLVLPEPKDPELTSTPTLRLADADAIAANLEKIGNAPVPKPETGAQQTEGESAAVTDAGQAPSRYLGSMLLGLKRAAMLSINGKQKPLFEGEKFGEVELVRVEADHVIIRSGGAEQKLELESRRGPVVGSAPVSPVYTGGVAPGGQPIPHTPAPGETLDAAPVQSNPEDAGQSEIERRRNEALERLRSRDPRRGGSVRPYGGPDSAERRRE